MTQPIGKISSTDSKTTMSLASTPTAPVLTPAAPMTDSAKILRKTSDFSTRKLRAEKEDGESLLHYLEEAHHVQKVQSSVKYGMRISPVIMTSWSKRMKCGNKISRRKWSRITCIPYQLLRSRARISIHT